MGIIYFVHAVGTDFVKIGFTQQRLSSRVFSLQVACPHELVPIAAFDGMQRYESIIHKRFAHLRVRREWFRLTEELRKFIAAVPVSNSESHAPLRSQTPADYETCEAWRESLDPHTEGF